MRIFFRSKWLIFGVVLILFIILVVLTKIAFVPIPKTIDLCANFPKVQGEIACEEAIKKATADTKGSIKNIAIGFFPLSRALERTPANSKKQMWLIDIDLKKPFTAPNGKDVKSLQIGIPVDGTKAIYRMPIKL